MSSDRHTTYVEQNDQPQQVYRTITTAIVLTIVTGIAGGALFFAQPSVLERWGKNMTFFVGGTLLLIQILVVGLAWWSARKLETGYTEAKQRIQALAQVDQEGAQIVAELERRTAEQVRLNRLVATLSAPLIPVGEHVVVIPFVGAVEHERLQYIRRNILQGVEEQRAQIALLDLTGAAEIAPRAIEPFKQLIAAIKLMGCRVILTGMNTQIARAILDQGGDLAAESRRNVQAGLAYADDLIAQTAAPVQIKNLS